jgi:hypothetical protein
MPANVERAPEQETNNAETELEQATDLAILACGGDLRASIQALIVANQYLEEAQSPALCLHLGWFRAEPDQSRQRI